MIKQIDDILIKYKDVDFTYEDDKKVFFEFIKELTTLIDNKDNIENLISIIEESFIEFTKFDKRILYNPYELFSIFELDLKGTKFDSDEIKESLDRFKNFPTR